MKLLKIVLTILSIILEVFQLSSQNIPIQSLTSGGKSLSTSGGIKLDVSLGQIATLSLSNNSTIRLTQGFQQANRFVITDLDVIELLGISLYPNPTTNFIVCEMGNQEQEKVYNWSIMNALGQIVDKGVFDDEKTQIDVSSLPSGNYYFYIQSEKKERGTIKFIKAE